MLNSDTGQELQSVESMKHITKSRNSFFRLQVCELADGIIGEY